MAITALLDALEREAEAELAALRASATADAEAALRAADVRAGQLTAAALTRARAARQAAADARVAEVARRRRRDVLLARADALARVEAAVAAALPGLLDGPAGAVLLARLLDGVRAVLAPDEPVTVRCTPALREQVAAALPGSGVTVRADPQVAAGLVAERGGGRVIIDARLATCLERWWPHLRVDLRPDAGAEERP